ncbi:MAG: hypothetical protein JXQ67_08295 [Campylobacterales bacterium]|nr:hypothetical protein [Campylobacterales bacterium]
MFRVILTLCFIWSVVLAQEEVREKKDVLERMIEPKVSFESAYLSDAGVGNSDGSVAVAKNMLRMNNAIGGISYTNWKFDWSGVNALPFGDGSSMPIEHMHSIRANVNIPYIINKEWFWLTSLSVRSTFEKELDDSYGAGIFSFASYKINENHSIQLGAFANYHPVTTLGLPVMSYSYRARKTDGFQLILGFPRAYMGYFINEKTLLRAGMIFSQSVIKLSSKSVIEASGYIEAEDYMGNFGLAHELSDSFRLEADLLYSIKRNFIIYDSSGQEQDYYTINPSFGVNFRIRYLF